MASTEQGLEIVGPDWHLLIGRSGGDHVVVRIQGRTYPDAHDYWDGNWLNATIEVAANSFRGAVRATLRADEWASFREGLESLATGVFKRVSYQTMEGWLSLTVEATSRGSVEATGELGDRKASGNRLSFRLDSDLSLSDVQGWVRMLKTIEERYPVRGEP